MKLRFLFITVIFPSTLVAVVYPGILSNTSVIEGVFYIADSLLCADGLLTVGGEVEVVSRLVIVLVVIVLNADVYPCVCNEASVAFCVTVVCSRCPVGIIGDIFTGSCDPACEHSSIHIKRILLSADISDLYAVSCCTESTSVIVKVVPASIADFVIALPARIFEETPAVLCHLSAVSQVVVVSVVFQQCVADHIAVIAEIIGLAVISSPGTCHVVAVVVSVDPLTVDSFPGSKRAEGSAESEHCGCGKHCNAEIFLLHIKNPPHGIHDQN